MKYRIKKKLSRWEIFWGEDRPRYYVQTKILSLGPLGDIWMTTDKHDSLAVAQLCIDFYIEQESDPDVEPIEEYINYP
jgi:hypothetical protein